MWVVAVFVGCCLAWFVLDLWFMDLFGIAEVGVLVLLRF